MTLWSRLSVTVVAVLLVFAAAAFTADKTATLRDAAEKGDAQAQANLGVMYYKGYGVAKDDKAAAAWFCKAADQGHALAEAALRQLQ